MQQKLSLLLLWMVPFVFSLSVHEFAHAWVANALGDPTAKFLGRLNLNPMSHADLFGTLIFPVVGFFFNFPLIGWAKPVPVNESNLKNRSRDGMWVAAAGPISNFILALIFTFCAAMLHKMSPSLAQNLQNSDIRSWGGMGALFLMCVFGLQLNVILGFFNFLPLPPLDGGRVLKGLFPQISPQLAIVERYGFMFLLILLYTGLLRFLLAPAFSLIAFLSSLI
ncbi:MAG: site-2 protease family protein [Bdellovibrionales bacterium]|nr:site-2 protease family protein [Bdellovibrionales bacterium]